MEGDAINEQLARRAVTYACRQLLVEQGDERYFAYYRGQTTPIHNASLLVAALAARVSDPASMEYAAAADAFAFTIARQRPDGSSPYGKAPVWDGSMDSTPRMCWRLFADGMWCRVTIRHSEPSIAASISI